MRKWLALLIVLVVALFCAYLHAAEPAPEHKYTITVQNDNGDTLHLACGLVPIVPPMKKGVDYR